MYFEKLHPKIGAMIKGIDLSNLSEKQIMKIDNLWIKYLILFFPDQKISDEDHINFGKSLVIWKNIHLYLIDHRKIQRFIVFRM